MNLFTFTNVLSARTVAVVILTAMITSVLPAHFFTAYAANVDAVGSVTVNVLPQPTNGWSEYFTVAFTGAGTLHLDDWTVEDNTGLRHTFGGVSLNSGDNYTVCGSATATTSVAITCDETIDNGGNTVWNNNGDTLILKDDNGDTIVVVTWALGINDTEETATAAVNYVPACVPQFDAAGITDIKNSTTGDYFDSVDDALADCDTTDGDTITLLDDISITEQIDLDRPVIFDGNGFAVDAAFAKTTNSNNSAIGVGSDNVTVMNVTLDGANGIDLHGINVYTANNVVVDTVTVSNFRTGLLVNGSEVTASNITTVGNVWHGINVDQGTNVSEPAVLTISNTSAHSENSPLPPADFIDGTHIPHIFIDDVTADATVVDTDGQYLSAEVDFRGERALVYTLFNEDILGSKDVVKICHSGNGKKYAANSPNVKSIITLPNGHDDHSYDIIPPFYYDLGDGTEFYAGKHWDIDGIAQYNNDCNDPKQDPDLAATATVTMCKFDEYQNPLAGWQLALLGDEVDSLTKNPTAAVQSMEVVPAGDYVVKAEGTYEYRGSTGLLADARFSQRQAGDPGFGTYPYQPWREASAVTGGLAVQVNGDKGALWGSVFSPSNTYYGSLSHSTTSNVDFYIYDDAYTDNAGTIELTLYEGFTGITNDNGCVTFDAVPLGEYEIEELQQTHWQNVSGLGTVVVEDETHEFTVVNSNQSVSPKECHLPYIVHFGEDSDDTTYSTTTADGLVITEVVGGYQIGLYDDGRAGIYRVQGTITFPIGTDTTSFTFTEAAGSDGLEQSHLIYPDRADRLGNTIEFDLFVNGADDVFIITDDSLENEANCDASPFPRKGSLHITSPAIEDEVLYGEHTFTAEYIDEDNDDDNIQWAIRKGTCDMNVAATVAGNVAGYNDPSSFSTTTFSALVDMSDWEDGEYCFVVNPNEDNGAEDLRATRTFILENQLAMCELEILSDTTTLVVETNQFAVETYIHDDWTDDIPATWVWGTAKVVDPEVDETLTFKETFTATTATSAQITVAADNGYALYVNGNLVQDRLNQKNNFQDLAVKSYDITSYIVDGENNLEVVVKNFADAGSNFMSNPAGVLYRLTLTAEENSCLRTTELKNDDTNGGGSESEEDTYIVEGYVYHDDDENEVFATTIEEGLEGWVVTAVSDGQSDVSTTTDNSGLYKLQLPAGIWTITFAVQDGWGATTPESYEITVPQVPVEITILQRLRQFIIPTAMAAVVETYKGDNFGVNETVSNNSISSARYNIGRGGGRSLVAGASATDESAVPKVLGDQVSVVPVGAPDAGTGSTRSFGISLLHVLYIRQKGTGAIK